MADLDEARQAKDELKSTLAGHAGVTAIGITPEDDGYGVLVRVQDDVVRAQAAVPRRVRGVNVRVGRSGPVVAQS